MSDTTERVRPWMSLVSLVLLLSLFLIPNGLRIAQAAEGPLSSEDVSTSGPRQTETLSAGTEYTCAIQSDGTLTCWGRMDMGHVSPPAGLFVQISVAWNHVCGIREDGTLACWGD